MMMHQVIEWPDGRDAFIDVSATGDLFVDVELVKDESPGRLQQKITKVLYDAVVNEARLRKENHELRERLVAADKQFAAVMRMVAMTKKDHP